MNKIDLGIYILTGLGIVGMVALLFVGKSVDVLLPIVTALVGVIIGKKEEVLGKFLKKLGSRKSKKEQI
jgi:hypothetical protein